MGNGRLRSPKATGNGQLAVGRVSRFAQRLGYALLDWSSQGLAASQFQPWVILNATDSRTLYAGAIPTASPPTRAALGLRLRRHGAIRAAAGGRLRWVIGNSTKREGETLEGQAAPTQRKKLAGELIVMHTGPPRAGSSYRACHETRFDAATAPVTGPASTPQATLLVERPLACYAGRSRASHGGCCRAGFMPVTVAAGCAGWPSVHALGWSGLPFAKHKTCQHTCSERNILTFFYCIVQQSAANYTHEYNKVFDSITSLPGFGFAPHGVILDSFAEHSGDLPGGVSGFPLFSQTGGDLGRLTFPLSL